MELVHRSSNGSSAHRVVALIGPRISAFELSIVIEVFGREAPPGTGWWYDLEIAGVGADPVPVAGGLLLQPTAGLDALASADTVVIPAWSVHDEVHPDAAVVAALRAAHRRGARLVSICSGAFVLARAGLLDGRPATTHWWYTEDLARDFPDVVVDPDVLYVDDGDLLTSAGSAAGIDLCLHVVRRDHGQKVANHVARALVVPPHRDGGQAQFVDRPVACCPDEPGIAPTLVWALDHLAEPLSVEQLAGHAAMSPRHFARRFRDVTGTTPRRWVLDRRIEAARDLLETTDWSVERIATEVGFGAAASLRARFTERVRATPTEYRRTFRGPTDLTVAVPSR